MPALLQLCRFQMPASSLGSDGIGFGQATAAGSGWTILPTPVAFWGSINGAQYSCICGRVRVVDRCPCGRNRGTYYQFHAGQRSRSGSGAGSPRAEGGDERALQCRLDERAGRSLGFRASVRASDVFRHRGLAERFRRPCRGSATTSMPGPWRTAPSTTSKASAASLPMILSLEADRMANLGAMSTRRELDLQRSVVKNEMRQNVLDQAGAPAGKPSGPGCFRSRIPTAAPSSARSPISMSATLDDVRGFFNTYYVPNNAVLVLVGDFDGRGCQVADRPDRSATCRAAPTLPRPAVPAIRRRARLNLGSQDRVPSPIVRRRLHRARLSQSPDNGAAQHRRRTARQWRDRRSCATGWSTKRASQPMPRACWTPGPARRPLHHRGRRRRRRLGRDAARRSCKAAIADFVARPLDAGGPGTRAQQSAACRPARQRESLKDRAGRARPTRPTCSER